MLYYVCSLTSHEKEETIACWNVIEYTLVLALLHYFHGIE
jgi:hypothetical protein